MKTRTGFVSNSSSSSFILKFDKNKDLRTQVDEMLDEVFEAIEGKYYFCDYIGNEFYKWCMDSDDLPSIRQMDFNDENPYIDGYPWKSTPEEIYENTDHMQIDYDQYCVNLVRNGDVPSFDLTIKDVNPDDYDFNDLYCGNYYDQESSSAIEEKILSYFEDA